MRTQRIGKRITKRQVRRTHRGSTHAPKFVVESEMGGKNVLEAPVNATVGSETPLVGAGVGQLAHQLKNISIKSRKKNVRRKYI